MRQNFSAKLLLALAVLTLPGATALSAPGDHGKGFSFTTKSEAAKQAIHDFVKAIENFESQNRLTELAQKAVDSDPDFAFGHYALAVIAISPEETKTELEKAIELSKGATEAEREYIRAMTLLRLSQPPDFEGALQIYSKLHQEYPGERMVPMLMGQLYLGQGKSKEAQNSFKTAAKLDDSTARVHAFLGNIHLVDGEYDKAREYYKKSLAMAPADSAPFFPYAGRVFAELYEGRIDGALKEADVYLEAYNQSGATQTFPAVFIWNMKARINLEHNRTEEALRCYKKGLETLEASTIDHTQKETWKGRYIHGVARTLAKMGRLDEAWNQTAAVEKMIADGGEQAQQYLPALHYLQGYVSLEAGEYSKAVERLSQIPQLDPFQMALMARAYEKLGDHEKALATYKQIVESAQNNLERALVLREARNKLAATSAS